MHQAVIEVELIKLDLEKKFKQLQSVVAEVW